MSGHRFPGKRLVGTALGRRLLDLGASSRAATDAASAAVQADGWLSNGGYAGEPLGEPGPLGSDMEMEGKWKK